VANLVIRDHYNSFDTSVVPNTNVEIARTNKRVASGLLRFDDRRRQMLLRWLVDGSRLIVCKLGD
jgi:hypothetical protein